MPIFGYCQPAPTPCRGFTLLELMIVCALVAILLMWAIPGYQSYLMRAYRGAAIEQLLAAAACEERIYAREFTYDTTRCLVPGDGHYEIRLEPAATVAATSFVAVAEPVAAQIADPCGHLQLDQSGQRSTGGPVARARQCWEGR